eukprot:14719369-Ditylum_brightwellii.AAC.1
MPPDKSAKKHKTLDDIAALSTKYNNLKLKYKKIHTESHSTHSCEMCNQVGGRGYSHSCHPFASCSGDYKTTVPFGPQKDFNMIRDFMKWKYTPNPDGSVYAMKNSLRWIWCCKCNQQGCHEEINCRAKEMRNQHMQSNKKAYVAPVPKPEKDTISIASSLDHTNDNMSTTSNSAFLGGKLINTD